VQARGILVAGADQDQRHRVLRNLMTSAQVILDAVLGTGARLPLEEGLAEVLQIAGTAIRERPDRPFLVAVDCPTGVNCDTGQAAEETLEADLTVTMAAAKPGLLIGQGSAKVGELVVADIGIPALPESGGEPVIRLTAAEEARGLLPRRPRQGHKGTFGRVLVVAGSINYPGAAALAARGAYRVGAGLVTLASPAPLQALLAPTLPEATWLLLPHQMGVIAEGAADVLAREMGKTQAIVFGPGFGQQETTVAFVESVFGARLAVAGGRIGFLHREAIPQGPAVSFSPCVVDADGLKLLARLPDWPARLPAGSVVTPHPGEMALLTGMTTDEIQADRIATALRFADQWNCVVVLKGAFTVVAADGKANVMPFATTALAHAGTGDVLAGAVAGLIAQGLESFQAATLAAYLHGEAGERAGLRIGSGRSVLAGEVADSLPQALADLESGASRDRPGR
jgi:NAD(P)H-hydrate epimerase